MIDKEAVFRESLAKLSDEFSHFAEKDLVRRVAEEAQGRGMNAKDVRELIENKMSTQEVLRLGELGDRAAKSGTKCVSRAERVPLHDGGNSEEGGPHARLGRAHGPKIRRD